MSEAEELILDDSFTGRNGEYDLTLIVDGHKIRVLKDVLCVASPVFYNMLQGDFKEKDQPEVELPGKEYQDFVEFLSCIYPNKLEQITYDSVYGILPLAFEYQVEILEKRCHMCLVEVVKTEHLSDASEICKHIKLTEKFPLPDLRKICFSAAPDLKLRKMETAASKHQIPENILLEIHRLARRKQELNKLDDGFLSKENRRMDVAKYLNSLFEKKTDISRYSDKQERIRAARLWYRFYPKNKGMLGKIVKSMKGMQVSDDIKEEYELLPETIKQRLDVEFIEPEPEAETENENDSD